MSDTCFRLIAMILISIQSSLVIVSIVYDLIRTKKFYDNLEIQHKEICKGVYSYEAPKK